MDNSFEAGLKHALENIETVKGSHCLDTEKIGLYIEGGLPEGEKKTVEEHIGLCPYCLNQLVELKELIYFRKKKASVSRKFLKRIMALSPEYSPFVERIAASFLLPFRYWRYTAVGLVSGCIAVVLSFAILSPEGRVQAPQRLDLNAFARVSALNAGGEVLRESHGAIINAGRLVATRLSPLVGASSIRITLKDGKTYEVKGLWKDDNRNLALLKIEDASLPHIALADLKQMSVGQKAFIISDPDRLKKGITEAVISDLKSLTGRRGEGGIQYIQLASFTAHYTEGAIVDSEGRLIGLLVAAEKNINFAVPLKGISRLTEEQKPIPVNELKDMKFSAEALNFYFRGILARDARKQDEAIEFFKKAAELNPNLEAAHLELGFLYYRKRFFDLERKEYEEALRINPEDTDTLFYLATNMETMGQYGKAVEVFERIIALDPQDADTYYELGLAYLAQGEKSRAMKAYSALKGLDPGLAEKLRRIIK